MPSEADFSLSAPTLDNPKIKSLHREHLLDVCQLTLKTLEAKLRVDKDDPNPKADLIVFPEVSVHLDDQRIVQSVADKTQAITFAGVVFTDHKGKLINFAHWFIPDYRDSGRQ